MEATSPALNGTMDAEDFAPRRPVRLNLGSGELPLDGYDNIDRKQGREVYPLELADASVEEIRASHVLEHFSHRETAAVLKEWARVLKPGGLLKVAVPNFLWIAEQYLRGSEVNIQGYTMGGHVDDDDRHGALFDAEELEVQLRDAGFYDIRPWKSEIDDCASLPVSLNLQGRKKTPLPKIRIGAILSAPRLGFQDHSTCWMRALVPLGILPDCFQGAFWGQCLERSMAQRIDERDWILTLDYDSIFERDQVEHLFRLAAEHPEADAIAPIQMGRGRDTVLMGVKRDDNGRPSPITFNEFRAAELWPVNAAHFGLTMIRTAALKKMPHPWFMGVPGKDGTWGDDRTDDDIYFWRKWRETGNTLFVAPHVTIGHAELVVTWPNRLLEPTYQHAADWNQAGPPANVWR